MPVTFHERSIAVEKILALSWWNRIEPRPRAPEVADTVAARVRDPLWMLTRQWQLGEFQGEDAASPAWTQLRARTTSFVGWRPRVISGPAPALNPISTALEELVETEGFSADIALLAESGLVFGRLLLDEGLTPAQRDKIIDAFRSEFPLDVSAVDPADTDAHRLAALCDGRSVDGIAIAATGPSAALMAHSDVAPFSSAVTAAVGTLRDELAETLGSIGADTGTAWRIDRQEYDVEIVAGRPGGSAMSLRATPDRDATFEWFTMDLVSRAEVATPPPAETTIKTSLLPTFVRFRGMPNHRWWDFERGSSDYGAVVPDRRDLAKLLVADFMLVHGNDYFVVPFDQEVGTVARIDELLVHDVFGGITIVDRADAEARPAGERWTCFSIATADQDGAPADFFLVPPSAGTARISSEAIEDLRFVRDEQANMVWAIELVTEGAAGRPWSGRQRHVASTQGEPAEVVPVTTAPLYYRLQSFVPWHWLPMVPIKINATTGEIVLERGQMVRPDGVTSPAPAGRLLRGAVPYRVREEVVPRTGLKVTREAVRSRWLAGETHLWIARRKTAGRGEGSSGLRYDEARRTPPPAP